MMMSAFMQSQGGGGGGPVACATPSAASALTSLDQDGDTAMSEAAVPASAASSSMPPLEDPNGGEEEEDDMQPGVRAIMGPDGLPLRMEGTSGHNLRPAHGIPDHWPIYETYALNVLDRWLKPASQDGGRSCGQFTSDPQAQAAKRLLFLLFRATQRAIESPPIDPRKLVSPNADPRTVANNLRDLVQEMVAGNPQRRAIRPRGVGGATLPAGEDPAMESLADDLSPRPDQMVSAQDAAHNADKGVFVFHDRQPGRTELQSALDMPGHGGGAHPREPPPILVRRISVMVEELMSETGGRTVGWRWWFMVHDPRVLLSRWVARVMAESAAVETRRRHRRERARDDASRPNPRLSDPIDPIESPNCYRAIRNVDHYEAALRTYHGRGGRAPPPETPQAPPIVVPRKDTPAVAGGVAAGPSAMHPCRVFDPAIAMRLHIAKTVCKRQRNFMAYRGPMSRRLGAMARPGRSVSYDPVLMTPLYVHEMPMPASRHRGLYINHLMWEAMYRNRDRLPAPLALAVEQDDMQRAVELSELLEEGQRALVSHLTRQAVTEKAIEQLEEAALTSGVSGPQHLRSRQRARHDEFAIGADLVGGDDDDADLSVEEGRSAAPGRSMFLPSAAADSDSDDDDEHGGGRAGRRGGRDLGEGADPAHVVDLAMFSLLKQSEETGASLSEEDIVRSVLLDLRMKNHYVRETISAMYDVDTPRYRAAMQKYREQGVAKCWATILAHLSDPMRLSAPVRSGVKFLMALNRRPNLIQRHKHAVKGQRALRAEQSRQRRRNDQALLLAALCRPGLDEASDPSDPGAAAGGGAASVYVDLSEDNPQTLCHEWPLAIARNLTAFGAWRVTMRHKCVKLFRCRPGAGPDLLHRLLIGQGTAWTYLWNLHGDELMWGPGGGGKSWMLHCVDKQSFPGQCEYIDHLTEKCFAVDEDWANDLLILIEEAPCRFVGQDERGNPVPGDEVLKTLLTRHYVVTTQPLVDEDGKRRRIKATSRTMCTLYLATNLVIKMLRNGQMPPILRRYVMDHVGWGKQDVPLAAINNPLSAEDDTPEQKAFYHQMAVTNVLCMLVEKLIEAKVLDDVNTDVWAFHTPWFFDRVSEMCKVPKASGSMRDMLLQKLRQTVIRFAVQLVFFSETSAHDIRCRKKPGTSGRSPEDWLPRRFEPAMLLKVQPFLVATEEMLVDVLTTTRSTYIPTTSWGVLKTIHKTKARVKERFRRITERHYRDLQNEHIKKKKKKKTGRRRRNRRNQRNRSRSSAAAPQAEATAPTEPAAANPPTPVPLGHGASVGPPPPLPSAQEMAEDDGLFDCTAGPRPGATGPQNVTASASGAAASASGGGVSELNDEEAERVRDDRNYCAFVGSDLGTVCDYFSQESHGSIESAVFRQVLGNLQKQWLPHKDRNRPKKDKRGSIQLHDDGTPVYDKTISSPIVVWEVTPEEGEAAKRSGGPAGQTQRQMCILIEYLEEKRKDSINDILREGLSYHGARARQVVTACGVRDIDRVREHGSTTSGTVVLHEYMDVITIVPKVGVYPTRINHFPESDVTDSFVYNQYLNTEGTGAPGFGKRTDRARRSQINVRGNLDKVLITEYWHNAGLDIKEENYPWNVTKALWKLADRGKDETGTPLSNRIKQHYPNSYRAPRRMRRSGGRATSLAASSGETVSLEDDNDDEEDDEDDEDDDSESESDEDDIMRLTDEEEDDSEPEEGPSTRGGLAAASPGDGDEEDEFELLLQESRKRKRGRR